MKKITCLIICLVNSALAQQWTFTGGDTIVSQRGGMEPYVCIDKTNIPYVVYFDQNTNGGCAVKKFVNNTWVSVGANLNIGYVYNTTMDFDSTNTPYVVYRDGATIKANVKRFDGVNWVSVGNQDFTPGPVSFTSIKIGPDNLPYVAFRDVNQNYSASVMKFDGNNWVYVGTPGFSPQAPASGAGRTKLAIDKTGTVYVAFLDLSNNWRASVMKYNGTSWVFVGNPNISGGGADSPSLVIDSYGTPIIAYTDGNAQVKRFNGVSWISVGMSAFCAADRPALAIDKHDRLYLAYTNNGMESVMKYNGSAWVQAGNAAFSPSVVVFSPSIAADTSGNLFVAFTDGTEQPPPPGWSGTYNGVCVMMLANNNIPTNTHPTSANSSFINIYPNPTSAKIQIGYNSLENERGIIKISNVSGQTLFIEDFIGCLNEEFNLSQFGKGIYIAEIKTEGAIERKKIVVE
jgi:hypothetical protein